MEQKPAAAAAGTKPKNKILKFLPRATSAVSFQSPPIFSPAKDKRSSDKTLKSHLGIGFSGPMVSIIPVDSRRKIKNSTLTSTAQEPTSPKVSCMGTVKCKHMQKIQNQKRNQNQKKKIIVSGEIKPPVKKVSRTTSFPERAERLTVVASPAAKIKKTTSSAIRNILGRKSDASNNERMGKNSKTTTSYLDMAPSLNQMKRFASGRDTLMNFDWTTQIAPVESDHRNYYSDEEREGKSDGEEGDEEVFIPVSAPLMINGGGININRGGVGLEPRKEINLWKRRTMPQPKPLQLHTMA